MTKCSNGSCRQVKIGLWARLKRIIRFNYLRIIRLKTSAHSIALGVALGVFVGFLPIIPLQSVTVLTLAVIFRGNKIAAFFSTFFSNAANLVPFYAMLYFVGSYFVPFDTLQLDYAHLKMTELIQQGWDIFIVMMVGGVVLGIPSAIIMYFVTRKAVLAYRRRRAAKLFKKAQLDVD